MSLFALFSRRGSSAPAARERLQILLAHERAFPGRPDLLARLREEILAVVARHVSIEEQAVQVSMRRTNAVSLLEIDIEIPDAGEEAPRLAGAA